MKEIELNVKNFKSEVINSEIPVLVDFWATWCGPCRMIAPVIEEIANDYDGKIKVGKVNVDDAMDIATEYGIEVIPTLIFFKNGEAVKRTTGVIEKREIVEIISSL